MRLSIKKVMIKFMIIEDSTSFSYAIIYEKGYQEFDTAISTISTKMKGITHVDFTGFNSSLFNGLQVYDAEDYVIKPKDGNSLFVMTNMVITPKQYQGKCPEDPESYQALCKTDKDCQQETSNKYGHGERTGRCVPSYRNSTLTVCEIHGWCPTEDDRLPMIKSNVSTNIPLLEGTKHATVLIKNQIDFMKFDVATYNIPNTNNRTYMKKCRYNAKTDPLCPIFRLQDIVSSCGDNYTQVAFKGAIYGIIIEWKCNLDYSIEECLPKYRFKRLDNSRSSISKGFNFRYVNYYVEKGKRYRTLTKAFGIKFELLAHGKAGKFNIIPLLTNLGAGIGLLGLATLCCDFIVLNLVPKRNVYRDYICADVTQEYEEHLREAAKEEKEEATRLKLMMVNKCAVRSPHTARKLLEML
ncbi:P2X purinoceptor 4-like isoform X1 [Clytia hemisphaerica]